LLDYNQAVQHSTGIAIGLKGTINIIFPSLMEGVIFIDEFKAFLADYPDVNLNLTVSSPGKVVDSLKKGRADLAVSPPYEMEIDPDIQTVELRRDRGILLVNEDHPFAQEGAVVKAAMLEEETFAVTIDEETPATSRNVKRKWREAGFELRHTVGVHNMDEMLMLIELNKAVGFLPEFARQFIDPNHGIRIVENIEYEEPEPELITSIGYLVDTPNPVVDNLLKYMKRK
jgi:DNA-binding transcriptional LysR family regulator